MSRLKRFKFIGYHTLIELLFFTMFFLLIYKNAPYHKGQ